MQIPGNAPSERHSVAHSSSLIRDCRGSPTLLNLKTKTPFLGHADSAALLVTASRRHAPSVVLSVAQCFIRNRIASGSRLAHAFSLSPVPWSMRYCTESSASPCDHARHTFRTRAPPLHFASTSCDHARPQRERPIVHSTIDINHTGPASQVPLALSLTKPLQNQPDQEKQPHAPLSSHLPHEHVVAPVQIL